MKARRQTYLETERTRAAAWKQSTPTLPAAAREPAPYVDKNGKLGPKDYDFCLPPAFATLSLLPEVREPMLALFAELGVPWHAGVGGGPSNHLLSSQVQCANALGQMVTDPERITRAFGASLGVCEVMQIEPGRFLTFEYIGDVDFFGEAINGHRVRGAHCTSVDAAVLYRAESGAVELALIEWKYTESYRPRAPTPAKDLVRRKRYGSALEAHDSPVRDDLLAFSDMLQEPIYQLMRQQLLAHELEQTHAHGADRVRVVHICPPANTAYQESLTSAQHKIGGSVKEVWKRLLREPDRFIPIDPALFLNPAITSEEFVHRYG